MKTVSLAGARVRIWGMVTSALLAPMAVMPGVAQAHPDVSVSAAPQDDLITVTGRSGASSLHHRLQVGTADVTQQAGPLRLGVAVQYGTLVRSNLNDYLAYESDHRSMRIRHEMFAGGTASLGLTGSWRLQASGGRVQMAMHDGLGDMARRRVLNDAALSGWRVTAGVQSPMGDGSVSLGWQMTRYAGERGSDPRQPTRGSAGRVGLAFNAPL